MSKGHNMPSINNVTEALKHMHTILSSSSPHGDDLAEANWYVSRNVILNKENKLPFGHAITVPDSEYKYKPSIGFMVIGIPSGKNKPFSKLKIGDTIYTFSDVVELVSGNEKFIIKLLTDNGFKITDITSEESTSGKGINKRYYYTSRIYYDVA